MIVTVLPVACPVAVDDVIHSAALYDNMIVLCAAGCTVDGAAGNGLIHQPSCMEIDPVPHGIAAAAVDAAYGGVDYSAAADMDDILLRAPRTAREAAVYGVGVDAAVDAVVIVFQGQRVARYIVSICGIVDGTGSTAGVVVRIRDIVARRV